eukprot:9625801-Alexandrium_andersonii.AAC.1
MWAVLVARARGTPAHRCIDNRAACSVSTKRPLRRAACARGPGSCGPMATCRRRSWPPSSGLAERQPEPPSSCLLYTSDAADDM